MRVPQLDLDRFDLVPFVVASTRDLAREGMVSIEAMGRTLLVLWNGGAPRVYDDVCPHLGLPLSMGALDKGAVRCRYHAWAFEAEDGSVRDQPTLSKPRACRLESYGALVAGGLVFAWLGDPSKVDVVRARLPAQVADDFVLHRVSFECPFYLALFNAVDYAHFAQHRYYRPLYSLYRRLRRDGHVPGQPFHWEVTGQDDNCARLRLVEAKRDLVLYPTCAEFRDEGGVNQFQTFVTPVSPTRTIYWECYRARTRNPAVRFAAHAVFRTVVVRLLDTEDKDWTSLSAPQFLTGENIHLSETDLPLGVHLRKFVLPYCEPRPPEAASA